MTGLELQPECWPIAVVNRLTIPEKNMQAHVSISLSPDVYICGH